MEETQTPQPSPQPMQPPPTVPPVTQPPKNNNMMLVTLGIIVLLLVLAGGVYWWMSQGRVPAIPEETSVMQEEESGEPEPTLTSSDSMEDIESDLEGTQVTVEDSEYSSVTTDINGL